MNSSQPPPLYSRLISSPWVTRLTPLIGGALAGTSLFVWTHQYLATFGVSLPVTAALALGLSVGAAAAWWGRHQFAESSLARYGRPLGWLTIAVWLVSFPWLLAAARWLLGGIPGAWLEVEATAFAVMLPLATGLFAVPAALMLSLGSRPRDAERDRTSYDFALSTRFVFGCGLGLGAAPVLGASWLSVEQIGFVVTVLAAVAFWRCLTEQAGPQPVSPKTRDTNLPSAAGDRSAWAWMAGVSLLAGLLIPVVSRLVMQFLPGSSFSHYALWSGLLCGIACGAVWAILLHRWQNETVSRDGVLVAGLILAVWPVVLLWLCPVLLQWNLSLSANVSSVPLLTGVRWLLSFVAMFPLGIAAGRIWRHRTSPALPSAMTSAAEGGAVCMAAGWVLMKALWVSPGVSVLLLVFCSLVVAAARLWRLGRARLTRRHWIAASLAALLIASLPLARHNHRPDLAAKLLFSTQTFAAHNLGIDRDLLPHIDDGRLAALSDGRDVIWSVWKHRGSQLMLRQNGIPDGIVSTNPRICPQFAGDVMHAVVPLVVHPQPERVLVLGLGSTATLSTCLSCPVREVTCIEGDQELIRINDEVIAAAAGFNVLNDDRVMLRTIDPTLALLAGGEQYDVVVIRDSHPFLMQQSSQYTQEFYASVSRRLHENGIACQRLQYADFGRQPIENILSTMRSVFPQVACLESAPGEMLLLALNSDQSLFDEAFLKRCEASHVRRLLAQLGWDWSVMLNLSAISPQQVDDLSAGNVTVNTIGNGQFAYRLPQEVMRWGPKWQEIRNLLNERGSRMLAWVGDAPDAQEVGKRLADMTEQQSLIVEHPDRFWAYRKTLKERLKERPRSKIIPVNHELQRALHPEDQRRKDYLEVLGEAATIDSPDPTDIARLVDFAEPYDPLVSYFLHQEAARLYERAETEDHAARLDHLRYSVYFGPPQDKSVQNVVAALELLIDEPDLIAEPHQRWDEMNALLDVLRQRSQLRVETDRTASPFELLDAEKSIKIAERAMDVMDILHADADVASTDWERRRTVLRRMLVRPMWTYHSQQAQRLATIDARISQTAEAPPENDEPQTK